MAEMREYHPDKMPDYKPIEAYGLIGDCRSAALIGDDGSLDWACFPDFDSPTTFAALLDPEKGGRFALRPTEPFRAYQEYEVGTNVLITHFLTAGGSVRVRDFMPILEERRRPSSEVHRQIEGAAGRVPMTLVFEPRFNYGKDVPHFEPLEHGVLAHHDHEDWEREHSLSLACPFDLVVDERGARAGFEVSAGEQFWVVADYDSHRPHPVVAYGSERRLHLTRSYWRHWVSRMVYQGNYRKRVERSLLVLKLLNSSVSGGFIAAPTTSLPEWIGSGRNWDYRYAWVRDSAFIMHALFNAGYVKEGTAYFDWILESCLSTDDGLKIMYSVHGETDLPESELPLRGYLDSRPVRIGNAASNQFQLDIYGSLIEAAVHYQRAGGVLTMVEMERLSGIVNHVRESWRKPDDGIWEARGQRQHYTYSKVWAWVALDRGWRAARRLGLNVPWKEWRNEAEKIREEVLEKGYNKKLGAFTQYYGGEILDSAVLCMPIVGIIDADDPRFHSTREVICRELAAGPYPLLYRYNPEIAKDGVGGPEGAFLMPSFWLVEDLELAGMHREAAATLEKLLRLASPLGLYSEEIHPENRRLLGNFPQGFSHLGMINAALRLESRDLVQRVRAHV
ncbi:MAG: glycoside hydrolase family 15 protein [Gammaproteobacteria bacterium]|nr:glycoside hydrolase family 15 protein [Gammaproteobacteria bacterium]